MKIKKAILTGGGRATRLHPITTTINKHLLPLANKPMIFHAIEKAVEAGIEEIYININPGETELQKYIGDGGHWGISIKFFEQTGGPQGIAHVVQEAHDFIGDDPFMFYLSDNILLGSLAGLLNDFHDNNYDCMLALSKVEHPEHFGIPVFDENNVLVDVLEKPKNPPNNFAVTGIYLYGPKVFFEAFKKINKSDRGEYEISSIHSQFLKDKLKVGHKEITGWWKDTGQANDLLTANRLLLSMMKERKIPSGVYIDLDSFLEDFIHIGVGTQIRKGTKIIGPVIIAENCILENCVVGPYVTVGQGAEICSAHVENSIILDNSSINCDIKISHSILGKSVVLKKRLETEFAGHRMIVGDKTIIEI